MDLRTRTVFHADGRHGDDRAVQRYSRETMQSPRKTGKGACDSIRARTMPRISWVYYSTSAKNFHRCSLRGEGGSDTQQLCYAQNGFTANITGLYLQPAKSAQWHDCTESPRNNSWTRAGPSEEAVTVSAAGQGTSTKCQLCGTMGHGARECYLFRGGKPNRRSIVCYYCSKPGH